MALHQTSRPPLCSEFLLAYEKVKHALYRSVAAFSLHCLLNVMFRTDQKVSSVKEPLNRVTEGTDTIYERRAPLKQPFFARIYLLDAQFQEKCRRLSTVEYRYNEIMDIKKEQRFPFEASVNVHVFHISSLRSRISFTAGYNEPPMSQWSFRVQCQFLR